MNKTLILIVALLVGGCKQQAVAEQTKETSTSKLRIENTLVIDMPKLDKEYCSNAENYGYGWDEKVGRCYTPVTVNYDKFRIYYQKDSYKFDRELTRNLMMQEVK